MTISETIFLNKEKLARAPIQCANPALHVGRFIQHILSIDSAELYLRWEEELAEPAKKKLDALIEKRLSGVPFQYLTGREGFWDSEFAVGPGVLIPRPETELLVETLLHREHRTELEAAELGAGSGNIGISVCLQRPGWVWHAFEKSSDSLPYLEVNRALLPKTAAYEVHAADFFGAASDFAPYDWIVSNPPYVAIEDWGALPLEVKREPKVALDGGNGGVKILSRLIEISRKLLREGGGILFEIGCTQGERIRQLCERHGFTDVEILEDHAHLPRAVTARGGKTWIR